MRAVSKKKIAPVRRSIYTAGTGWYGGRDGKEHTAGRCFCSACTTTPAMTIEPGQKMMALCFVSKGKIELREVPIPKPGPGQALLKVTMTTICGTDVHIMKGEIDVRPGLVIGHEPVGVIAALGEGVEGYKVGQRVIAGAITPCGTCYSCLSGMKAQCGGQAAGGWKIGHLLDGSQAEYILIPDATANLTPIPAHLTDEQVLMCPDIMSTGFGGAESANIQIGDDVVVFAQGPIGLCATVGSKLRGAARIIAVDGVDSRLALAKKMGATHTINYKKQDAIKTIMEITEGRGADVAIEALGTQPTFEACLRSLKAGGTLSSLGVYSGKLELPFDAFAAGLGDHKIVTTLCPGGKERMRRLMATLASGTVDLKPFVTHRFKLENILEAYDLFAHQRDGVIKVAITP